MSTDNLHQSTWESCTAEGSRLSVLREGLTTTFREKLQWLEEAEDLSLRFAINRKRALAEGRLTQPSDTTPEANP